MAERREGKENEGGKEGGGGRERGEKEREGGRRWPPAQVISKCEKLFGADDEETLDAGGIKEG